MTTAGTPGALAHGIFKDRLGWAFRAYERFKASLSEETREHLARGDADKEPYVVVFGKTQVGKTTLLLDLMGLREDALLRVGRVLRGLREQGKSATATAMEYRRSPDENWRLDTRSGAGMQVLAGDREMAEALAKLREAMTAGQITSDEPVVVWIPRGCFRTDPQAGSARMLDLPGENAAEASEQAHVENMAKAYVPHADLILLVGRSDDLAFLHPGALTLPGIDDWQFVPNRFRIVTTYSFTPDSVLELARAHIEELDAELFRNLLLKEIRTIVALSPEAERTNLYFPLEFGESWSKARQTDSQLMQRLDPIVEGLKKELRDDIRASATETARFRNALDVHVIAQQKREAYNRKSSARLAGLHEDLKKAKEAGAAAEREQKRIKAHAESLRVMLKSSLEAAKTIDASMRIDPEPECEKVSGLDTSTDALFLCITRFESWLRQQFLAIRPTAGSAECLGSDISPDFHEHLPEVNRRIEHEFGPLRERMAAYWSSEYYPSVSDCFADDKSRLRSDMRDAASAVSELAARVWREAAEHQVSRLRSDAAEADSQQMALDRAIEHEKAIAQDLKGDLKKIEAELAAQRQRLHADEWLGTQFRALLDEEYLHELGTRHATVMSSTSPVDAFMTLLSTAALGEERKKIMIGIQ